jgi:hypothetical protein
VLSVSYIRWATMGRDTVSPLATRAKKIREMVDSAG